MLWLYLVTDRAGSWAVLRRRPEQEPPLADAAAIVELIAAYEDAAEAVDALVRLESRLARERPQVRPSLPSGPRRRDPRGH